MVSAESDHAGQPQRDDSPPILIAGVDDATKCPCIGSIFIAGVVADHATIARWHKLGVKDSKLLTRKRRDELARVIRSTAFTTSTREITPALIDDKSLNLNAWEMITVLQVIQNLRRRTRFIDVYIDNWEVSRKVFDRRLASLATAESKDLLARGNIVLRMRLLARLNLIAEHQADENYTIVGAASILAKSASDRQYDRYRKIYGDFGSGNPGDRKTRHFLWLHRHAPVPIIRTSWKTFRVLAELENPDKNPLDGLKDTDDTTERGSLE